MGCTMYMETQLAGLVPAMFLAEGEKQHLDILRFMMHWDLEAFIDMRLTTK